MADRTSAIYDPVMYFPGDPIRCMVAEMVALAVRDAKALGLGKLPMGEPALPKGPRRAKRVARLVGELEAWAESADFEGEVEFVGLEPDAVRDRIYELLEGKDSTEVSKPPALVLVAA